MSSNQQGPIGAIEQGTDEVAEESASPHRALHEMVARGGSFSGRERNCAFRNLGDGRFADVSAATGFDFADDARAVVTLDYDGDGDLDVITTNRTAPRLRVLLNRSERLAGAGTRRGVTLELVGAKGELASAVSATVTLNLSGEAPITRSIAAGSGFLGATAARLVMSAGPAPKTSGEAPDKDRLAEVTVTWPGGGRDVYGAIDVHSGASYRLRRGSATAEESAASATPIQGSKAAAAQPDAEGPGCSTTTVSAFLTVPEPLPILPEGLDGPTAVTLWSEACPLCAEELAKWKESSADLRVLALSVDEAIASASGTTFDAAAVDDAIASFGKPSSMRVEFGTASVTFLESLQTALDRPFARDEDMALPITVVLDAEGQLAAIHRGPVSPETVAEQVAFLAAQGAARPESRRQRSSPLQGRWRTKPPTASTTAVARAWMESGRVIEACDLLQRSDAAGRLRVGDRAAARASGEAARLAFAAGDLKRAVAAAELTSRLRPEWPKGHFNRAVILDAADDVAAAESAYSRALALRPKYWQALANRGLLRGRTGRVDEGRRDLEAAIAMLPKNVPASQRRTVEEMLASLKN